MAKQVLEIPHNSLANMGGLGFRGCAARTDFEDIQSKANLVK